MVKKPSHYTRGSIECMSFIADRGLDYIEGNIVKYVTRFPFKGTPRTDVEKAAYYTERLLTLWMAGEQTAPADRNYDRVYKWNPVDYVLDQRMKYLPGRTVFLACNYRTDQDLLEMIVCLERLKQSLPG